MAARELDDFLIVRIGHAAHKMHSVPIHAVADFTLHLGAIPTFFGAFLAIRRLVSANDNRACIWAGIQN